MAKPEEYFTKLMLQSEDNLKAFYTDLNAQVMKVVHSYIDKTGKIPLRNKDLLRQDIAKIVDNAFIGTPTLRNQIQPFRVNKGILIPNSPYMKVLWSGVRSATKLGIVKHISIIKSRSKTEVKEMTSKVPYAPDTWSRVGEYEAFYIQYKKDETAAWYNPKGILQGTRYGKHEEVDFTQEQLKQMYGGYLSHSHPHGLPLSLPDCRLCISQHLQAIHAVGTTPEGYMYSYVFIPKEPINLDDFTEAYKSEIAQYNLTEETDPESLAIRRNAEHKVLELLSQRFGFLYKRLYIGSAK